MSLSGDPVEPIGGSGAETVQQRRAESSLWTRLRAPLVEHEGYRGDSWCSLLPETMAVLRRPGRLRDAADE